MLVLRLGEVHEDDCVELSTTNDWLPLDGVADVSLENVQLCCCPVCIDGPTTPVAAADIPRHETATGRQAEAADGAQTAPQP